MKRTFAVVSCILLGSIGFTFAQDAGNERSADRTLRGSGRVNASTLGMEFQLPLGEYPGRGINVPINLSYSSKVWRLDYMMHGNVPGASWSDCYAHYRAEYGEKSASGWTSSMAAPYIEYVGMSDHYTSQGLPYTDFTVGCPTSQDPNESYPIYYVRRILVHLPGGETHEVRPDDTLIEAQPAGSTGSSPYNTANWNATYYAVDGSNIKYVQNSATNTYRLLMPDGSFYDFNASGGLANTANKFTDRNGNFTTYHGPGSVDSNGITHPNGYWRDTLGRNISIPVGLQAPGSPTPSGSPQVYSMPGMTGTYKLHWKHLNGGTQAESAMTDISGPNYQLKYPGETYGCNNPFPTYCTRPASDTLFRANGTDFMMAHALFNPVVLTEIELPTGQKYKFTYDNYGRIEQIHYPTGGQEHFTYAVVPTLSTLEPESSAGQTNFGVTNRKVYKTAGDPSPYEWAYSAMYVQPGGYKITINNPGGTRSERKLRRGNDACVGCQTGTFGYDNPLAGMAYEEIAYDSANRIVSKKLTEWQPSNLQVSILYGSNPNPFPAGNYAGWHSRVVQEESQIYDTLSNGISATTTFEYEGDLNLRETPLLTKRSSQYAFVPDPGSPPSNPGCRRSRRL